MPSKSKAEYDDEIPKVGWGTFVSSLPEPAVFVASLALSYYLIFQSPQSNWLGLLHLAEGLNGSPNLSDAVAVFIPACITAFGSLFFISSSASRNIRNRRIRDMIMNIGFIISLIIVIMLVLLVIDFKDALNLCTHVGSNPSSGSFQCAQLPGNTIKNLDLMFLSISGLTVVSMVLSKFIIVVFRER